MRLRGILFTIPLILAASPLLSESWTAGPLALCEDQALSVVIFNPSEYTINKSANWGEAKSGRTIDSVVFSVAPGTGVTVTFERDHIVVGAGHVLRAEMTHPSKCTSPTMGVAVIESADDGPDGTYSSGRIVSAQLRTQTHAPARTVYSGATSALAAVSEPIALDPYKNFKFQVKWDGRHGAAVEVSLIDALAGTTVESKSFRLDPARPYAEFAATPPAGQYVVSIRRLGLAGGKAQRDSVYISVSEEPANNDIGVEELTIAHEHIEYRPI